MISGTAKWFACVLALFAIGCTVTEDEVRSYSRYSNGRAKLFAVLIAPEFDVKLRNAAALELVGLKALTDLEEGLKTMPEGDRTTVVDTLFADQKNALQGANQQKQIRAKDVMFIIHPYSHGETKEELENLLIRWTTEKFTLRYRFGKYDTEKILAGIGKKAVPHMLSLLKAGKDTARAARILKSLDDPQAVENAADAIIESLETKIMENSEPKLLALGSLGGPKAVGYLNTLAANNKTAGAWDRLKAMDELLKLSDRSSAASATSVVADVDAQFDLRRKALDLLDKVGDRESLPALYTAVADGDLRGKAWALALRFGGVEALDRLLKKEVKADWKLDKAEVNGLVVSMAKLGPSAEGPLIAALKKRKNLPLRVIGIRGLAQQGTSSSVDALQELMDDGTPLGEMGPTTIGVEAVTAARKAGSR